MGGCVARVRHTYGGVRGAIPPLIAALSSFISPAAPLIAPILHLTHIHSQVICGPYDEMCMLLIHIIPISLAAAVFFTFTSWRLLSFNRVLWLGGFLWFCMVVLLFALTACTDPGLIPRGVPEDKHRDPWFMRDDHKSHSKDVGELRQKQWVYRVEYDDDGRSPRIDPRVTKKRMQEVSQSPSKKLAFDAGDVVLVRSRKRGVEPRQGKVVSKESGFQWCKTCNVYRPPGAQHCKWCDGCVLALDHHCPVFNNCIAGRNLQHFSFSIVFSIGGIIVHLLCAVLASAEWAFAWEDAGTLTNSRRAEHANLVRFGGVLGVLVIVVLSILVLSWLATICIGCCPCHVPNFSYIPRNGRFCFCFRYPPSMIYASLQDTVRVRVASVEVARRKWGPNVKIVDGLLNPLPDAER